MNNNFDELVIEFKQLRGAYFNKYSENMKKFSYHYEEHKLFKYVVESLDTKFSEIEQTAQRQVREYLKNNPN
jgi:hypothetical protein